MFNHRPPPCPLFCVPTHPVANASALLYLGRMPAAIQPGPEARRALIFSVLAASYMLVTFHRLCPAAVAADMMRDLAAGGGLLGMLSGAYFYSYALMQVPAGLLADSWGARRATSAFFLLAAVGAVIMGLSPGAGWAMAGRVLVGAGLSMTWVCTLKTLAVWYPPERFASMTGILVAMGGLGSLLASAPLAWASHHLGWRTAFLALGAASLALSGLLWLVVRDSPAQAGLRAAAFPQAAEPGGRDLLPGVRAVVSNRWAWLVAAWLLLDNGVFFSLAGLWAGPYLKHVHAAEPGDVGLILAMFSVGLVTGAPFMSFMSTRLLKSRKKALAVSAAVLCGCLALLALRTGEVSRAELYVLFYLIGVSGGTTPVVAFTSAKELFPISLAGTAVGILNIFPFAGGAVFQPLVGMILEAGGRTPSGDFTLEAYRSAFWFLAAASGALFAVCLAMKETFGAGQGQSDVSHSGNAKPGDGGRPRDDRPTYG